MIQNISPQIEGIKLVSVDMMDGVIAEFWRGTRSVRTNGMYEVYRVERLLNFPRRTVFLPRKAGTVTLPLGFSEMATLSRRKKGRGKLELWRTLL